MDVSRKQEDRIELAPESSAGPHGFSLTPGSRKVLLRDSLTLLVLILATIALYVVTSLLFRSFAARRSQLAREFAAKAESALRVGHAEEAIGALRVSLSYDPDNSANRLLFADALAQAHHSEEATNYFITLREAQPADGYINLQLARLARAKGDTSGAIEYYRASSLGNWTGDALTERRKVQLEFADYLIRTHDLRSARSEILIAATNSPETADLDELFGDEFMKADDPNTAVAYYRKAARLDPGRFSALFKAGTIAYGLADYHDSAELLARAVKVAKGAHDPRVAQARALAETSRKILSLTISPATPALQRVEHLRTALPIAKSRLAACLAQIGSGAPPSQSLQLLSGQWHSAAKLIANKIKPEDTASQDALSQLIFDTEIQTAQICGFPTGDDAVLLMLAREGHER